MKKLILFLLASTTALNLFSQTLENELIFKPSKNNWATELNINPFKGELSLNNSLKQIKVRKFTQDNLALRFGFNANRLSSNFENLNPYGTNASVYKNNKSSTTVGINFGVEKHFKGTKRLSPYLGLDVELANKSSKQEITNGQITTTIKGAWTNVATSYTGYDQYGNPITRQTFSEDEKAFFSYGLNVVSGFDFYISRHFFFGYEFSFGFQNKNYKDLEYSTTGSSSNSPLNNTEQKNSAFTFGPSIVNGIRLGYVL